MATRATTLSPFHVEALNRIDIEFYKDRKVKDAWKALLDNFENYPKDAADNNYQRQLETCNESSRAMLVDLLCEMARSLGYEFDRVHLRRGVYQPQGHDWIELENSVIRSGFAQILADKKALPIYLATAVNQADKTDRKEEGPKE
jgi:hypothetical protein